TPVARPACVESPYTWQHVEPGLDALDASLDLDGDNRPDRLVGSASWGSAEETRTVFVELTRDRSTVEASTTGSFADMVTRQPVPARLVNLPEVRRAVELALFDRVCDAPDPSLARVLAGTPAWSPGRPTIVANYTVRVADEWVSYAAINHKRTRKLDLMGGFTARARRGPLALLTTAHGVVLVDDGGRFSWLFVIEHARGKLRFPSVTAARFRGAKASIKVDGKLIDVSLPAL
ncbi:MAG: hypothetical protein ABI867_32465, partial [Kofleriaceae bacterium]